MSQNPFPARLPRTWEEGIGGVSAGALGFIVGNVPGIGIGYNNAIDYIRYKNDSKRQRMMATPESRGRSRVRSYSRSRSRARSAPPLRTRSASNGSRRDMSISSAGSVAISSASNPALSVVDSNRSVSILKGKFKSKKLSKKAKRIRRKKVRFVKKVKNALVKLGPQNSYKEFCSAAYNLDGYATQNQTWDTRMEQTFTFSNVAEANEGRGFWYGGTNFSGASRTQDVPGLVNIENNELFLYQTQSAGAPYNGTFAGLATATTGAISVGADNLKVWISRIKYTISITNRISTKPICVDVYDMVAQKNMAPNSQYASANRAYNTCIANNTFSYNNPSATNTQKVTLDDPQATPADIPGFTNWWKPKTATRLLLQAGETKMLTYYGEKGWYDATKHNSLACIAGKTTEFLFIVGGGQCQGLINTDPWPQIKWTKQIIYRNQQGFGKPKNLVISNTTTV